jgi:phospholipase C
LKKKLGAFGFHGLGLDLWEVFVCLFDVWGCAVVHEAVGPTATSHFEHSSIPATVRKLFNLPSPPLTAREAWAGTFEDILSQRTTPRTDAPGLHQVSIPHGSLPLTSSFVGFEGLLVQL